MANQTAQQRRVREALAKLEPEIRKAWIEALAKTTNALDRKALIRALDARDIERANRVLRINQALLGPLFEAIRSGFIVGGTLVAADLPKGLRGVFGFDGRHYRAEAWVTQHVGGFIQGIADDTMAMTRTVIREGIEAGTSSSKLARQITGRVVGSKRVGGFLGLTTQQANSIMSDQAKLLSGDPKLMREYLTLKQRDKRFDPQIRKSIRDGKSIRGTNLARIIETHKSKALGYRGRLLAKDQSQTALAEGRAEGYRQVLENPEVETVTKKWIHGHSVNPRPDHVGMGGATIGFDEVFVMDDGARVNQPHDPAGGARHSSHCHCSTFYRVNFRRD